MSTLAFERNYTKERAWDMEVRGSKRLKSLEDNVVYLFPCEFVQIADYIAIIKQGDRITTTEYFTQENGDLVLGNYDVKEVYLVETTHSDLLKAHKECVKSGELEKSRHDAKNMTLEEFELCAWGEIYCWTHKYKDSTLVERLYV